MTKVEKIGRYIVGCIIASEESEQIASIALVQRVPKAVIRREVYNEKDAKKVFDEFVKIAEKLDKLDKALQGAQ
jgi:hypothetical protein